MICHVRGKRTFLTNKILPKKRVKMNKKSTYLLLVGALLHGKKVICTHGLLQLAGLARHLSTQHGGVQLAL